MSDVKRRLFFYAIQVNLLLWMIAIAVVLNGANAQLTRSVVVAGFVFAALFQHQAYYRLYKLPTPSQPA